MRLIAALLLFVTASAHAATGMMGDWKSPTNSIVRVYACGSDICLKVVRLSPDAPETTDKENPDATLRGRPLCGLTVGTGFHQDDATHLSGGRLYDPKSGHTYRGMIVAEGDTLKLHGYIGVSLFGRTETWLRVAAVDECR